MLNNAWREARAMLNALELDTRSLENEYQRLLSENDALKAELALLRQEILAHRSEL